MTDTMLAGEIRREQNRHDPERRQFSVLCFRGWCDHEFKIRDIPAMITTLTGQSYPPAAHLKRSECPTPETCQCVCHDSDHRAEASKP